MCIRNITSLITNTKLNSITVKK